MYEIFKDYKNAYIIANNVYQATLKSLNDVNYDLTLIEDLNKLVNLLKENISKWSETVVLEKIENLKDGLDPENHEIN